MRFQTSRPAPGRPLRPAGASRKRAKSARAKPAPTAWVAREILDIEKVNIELVPLGKTITVPKGAALRDVLFAEGVEFPCGGQGKCHGCRVKVLAGELPITREQEENLDAASLAEGWRLSCQGNVHSDLKLELAQWEATILGDDTWFQFTPRAGLGVAVDVGTTTIVVQLLDLRDGHILAVRAELNEQARHGADIMSRVALATDRGRQRELEGLIRGQVGRMVESLLRESNTPSILIETVVLVGNTVMHHLFCGVALEPLAHHPFEPRDDGLKAFRPADLDWNLRPRTRVLFLPCLGGFVGSDLLAGILATHLHQSDDLRVLIDLGTNGEIVVGNRQKLLCASTAAGPAFEGARISNGMRAATGAISAVSIEAGELKCQVLGNTQPRGVCGSGLVDAVAAGLTLKRIAPNGRLDSCDHIFLAPSVELTQNDVREVQLAKGAIAAGVRILLREWGADLDAVTQVYLAGAFGNYINRASARRIGLLNFPLDRVVPAGNTALLGAKIALFESYQRPSDFSDLRQRISHVPLNEDERFQEIYAEEMRFPAP